LPLVSEKMAAAYAVLAAENLAVPLGVVEVEYTDSETALKAAWEMGLSRDAEVRTSSPKMLMDPEVKATASDEWFTPERVKTLYRDVTAWAKVLYEDFAKNSDLTDLALVAARRASRFQTQIFKILALREDDFHRPVAVITFDRPLVPPMPSLRDRLRTATCAAKAYRIAANIWNRLPMKRHPVWSPISPGRNLSPADPAIGRDRI
jgi:hypothetical protein